MADERTLDHAESFNERVQDRTIRHMLYLERLKTRQAREITEAIDRDIIPDLVSQLQARLFQIDQQGFDRGPATTQRVKQMIDELAAITGRFKDINTRVQGDLFDIAIQEIEWQKDMMNHEARFDLNMITPEPEQIRAAVFGKPFDGRTLEEWFDSLSNSVQERLKQQIQIGITEGESSTQIVRRVAGTKMHPGILQQARHQTAAVVQTAVAHASNAARLEMFAANSDILKGVQWVATLDSRTCLRCAPLDGLVYKLNKGPRPPVHVNCRCAVVPITKSFKELGIDAESVPPKYRAAMNGRVPAEITYNEWLKKQPVQVQIDALGKSRAKLFRNGDLDVSAFTNNQRQELTLEQLKAKDPGAFKKADM